MGLFEELAETYPLEDVHPYGLVLVVPHSSFKGEWKPILESEGVQIYTNSYNGRVCFFLRKKNSNSQAQAEPQAPPASQQQPKPDLKPLVWNEQTFKLVWEMRERGLSYKSIALKLREMGFKTSATTILRKMKMRENDPTMPKPTAKANCEGSDGLFREILEGASVLYEKRLKRACALLLRQASNMIEQL